MTNNAKLATCNTQLTIGWLYPQLMSTYGDRGNILVLQKRSEWRKINVEIIPIDQSTSDQKLKTIDLLFGGGAQDREQEIVMRDLQKKKNVITELIANNMPALFVCGAPQLMGHYYEPAEGKQIEGLGIFDMITRHPGPKQDRLIGNIIAEIQTNNIPNLYSLVTNHFIVGFENHGGRTHLGKTAKPFAKVIKGYGNNGEDGTEGIIYNNAIGSYLHGPLLPKNPQLADWLITTALHVKYKKRIILQPFDDFLEQNARKTIANRLGLKV